MMVFKMPRRLRHFIDLIIVLTQKDLGVRYRNNFLGYLWSIAHPLTYAFVFFVAFKLIIKIQTENYALFVTAGLFPWQWLSNSITSSSTSFVSYAQVVKKMNFPRYAIPLSLVMQDAVHFLLALPVIMALVMAYHRPFTAAWIWGVPALMLTQLLITYGLALLISSVTLFFRDLERLCAIGLTVAFYFTPVVYSSSMVPARFRSLLYLNPFAVQIMAWRELFINGRFDAGVGAAALAHGIFFLAVGYAVFRRLAPKFSEVL